MTPQSTSPLPAVASAAHAIGLTNARPSGAAITVRAPLSTTIARVAAARRRATPQTIRLHVRRGHAGEPAHLGRVRRQDARRRRAASTAPRRSRARSARPRPAPSAAARSTPAAARPRACPSPVGIPGPIAIACARAAELGQRRDAPRRRRPRRPSRSARSSAPPPSRRAPPAPARSTPASPARRPRAAPTARPAPRRPSCRASPRPPAGAPRCPCAPTARRRGSSAATPALSSRKVRAAAPPSAPVRIGTPSSTTSTRPTGASASRNSPACARPSSR